MGKAVSPPRERDLYSRCHSCFIHLVSLETTSRIFPMSTPVLHYGEFKCLLITLALLTWVSFLNRVCSCKFINIVDTQFCVSACEQHRYIKRKTKKFLQIPWLNHLSSLLRVLTKFCSLTLDKLLFKSYFCEPRLDFVLFKATSACHKTVS